MKIIPTKEQKEVRNELMWILTGEKTIIHELKTYILPYEKDEDLRSKIEGLIYWFEHRTKGNIDNLERIIDEFWSRDILYKGSSD